MPQLTATNIYSGYVCIYIIYIGGFWGNLCVPGTLHPLCTSEYQISTIDIQIPYKKMVFKILYLPHCVNHCVHCVLRENHNCHCKMAFIVILTCVSLTMEHTIDYFHPWYIWPLQWRHNGRDGVSNHRRLGCLLNRWFSRRLKKISKPRVKGLCVGNSLVTGEFPSQRASFAENVSIWLRHHVSLIM